MTVTAIDTVRELEIFVLKAPQTDIPTSHLIHAGVYARTIKIPAGVVLTGALIKTATVLVMDGECAVYIGDETKLLIGHHVLAASANRKQAFFAMKDTYLTMIFATNSKAIHDAEEEFTDEAHRLSSRYENAVNHIVITGE